MRHGEWRLTYPGVDLSFGTGEHAVWNTSTPDFGEVELTTHDASLQRSDGLRFGQDYTTGRVITFEFGVRPDPNIPGSTVRTVMDRLAAAWSGDTIRRQVGAAAELTCCYDGSQRTVFGRPRKFHMDLSTASTNGYARAVASFVCADEVFYGGTQNSATVTFSPELGGGLVAPLEEPLATTLSSDRSSVLTITGSRPAWPRIEITGTITNPVVDVIGGPRIGLTGTLAWDHTAVIHTAPWDRGVRINGTPAPGRIAPGSTRLGGAAIPPGTYEWALRGTSTTGDARATVFWRDTFAGV